MIGGKFESLWCIVIVVIVVAIANFGDENGQHCNKQNDDQEVQYYLDADVSSVHLIRLFVR